MMFVPTRTTPVSVRIGWSTGPREPNGCRLWLGRRVNGYGTTKIGGRDESVPRLILGLRRGDPRDACHTCDVRGCVEPAHLYAGTRSRNIRDAVERRRHFQVKKTHCRNGHPYDAANTYWNKRKRFCRQCDKDRRTK